MKSTEAKIMASHMTGQAIAIDMTKKLEQIATNAKHSQLVKFSDIAPRTEFQGAKLDEVV